MRDAVLRVFLAETFHGDVDEIAFERSLPDYGIAALFKMISELPFAETNRIPFDLPEAETELVAGYHTEYSAMKFAMFFLGEYTHMVTTSFLVVTLFFGGWNLPWVATADWCGTDRNISVRAWLSRPR